MCIAIYSPIGNDIPKEDYLKSSFENNPDGAGFAFNTDKGLVRIQKGFMTWDSFKNAFEKANKDYNFKDRGVLIHFRITTHGGTNAECTHPFPITSDSGIMHKLQYESPFAVIHNGIISLTSGETKGRDKMSDTMVFVEKYLTRIAGYKGWFGNPTTMPLIYDLIDSKMAIINGKGEIKSTSGFVQDKDGNFYSNTSYKENRVRYSTVPYSGWSSVSSDYNSSSYPGSGYNYYDDWDDMLSKDYYTSELMRVSPGQQIMLEDGSLFTYEDFKNLTEGEWAVYVDNEGYFYVYDDNSKPKGVKSEEYRVVPSKYLEFMGVGYLFDGNCSEIEFKCTNYTIWR